ncbi:MAG: nitroreductase family protein [Desulforhopalus sp.]
MGVITINRERCRKDNICMAVCPMDLFREGSSGFPETIPEAQNDCIDCGHCQAACPHEALTLMDDFHHECAQVVTTQTLNWETVENLVKGRRSIRKYRDEPIPRATLDRLFDMVRWAPTARNVQPVNWTMVEDRQQVRVLAGMVVEWMQGKDLYPGLETAWEKGRDLILRDAPHLAIAHAPVHGLSPAIDCTIAVTTLELAASALGFGGCWAGIFMAAANDYAPLIELLQLPEDHNVYGALMLGYPHLRYQRIPQRKKAGISWFKNDPVS